MAFNPIIKGFNGTWKLITRGYEQVLGVGIKTRFCRVFTEPYTCQRTTTSSFVCQRISTELFICQEVTTE